MGGQTTLLERYANRIEELLIAFEEHKKARNKESAHLGLEAYDLAKECGDAQLIIKAGTSLSHFYTDITSEFHKAIRVITEVIELINEQEHRSIVSEFYRRLGLNYDYTGELVKSKEAYDKSIVLLEDRTDLDQAAILTLARSLFNVSIIYGNLGLENLSETNLKKAYQLFLQADYKAGICRCLISFGVALYEKQGDTTEVLNYYREAANIARDIHDDPPFCVAMGNIGIVSAEKGDFTSALEAAMEALEVAQRSVNKHFLFSIHRQLARIYQLKKEYEKANQWYEGGERLFIEMGRTLDQFEFYRFWAETLHAMGRHEEAYAKLYNFISSKDELHKINKEAAVTDAMLRFQLEEGRKEQELLKKKNAEIEEYARKLEASNHELNQFAYVASHDMKEPLRMISNYSQLLNRSLGNHLSDKDVQYLQFINEGAKRMMNIINSILQLSKINTISQPGPVNLNKVLEEVKQGLSVQIVERGARIQAPALPTVNVDQLQVLQLMQNLISNAMKYNRNAEVRVEIGYEETETCHQLSIADNGIGIAPDYREKVFIIFQRLHGREEFDGTGIGLAICKKIVDNFKGKIWIEDSPLGGTKFCFTIPKQ